MLLHTNNQRDTRIARSWLLPWFGWLLVLCINMAGPFPYFHCHAAQDHDDLIRHIMLHHGGDFTQVNLGWHYHTELPHDHDEAPTPRQERPSPIQEPCAQLTIRLLTDHAACFDLATDPLHLWDSVRLTGSTPTHFFDGFASSLALPVRLGVMLI